MQEWIEWDSGSPVDEERLEVSILMDLYGPLLTDRQLEMLEMYYNSDLSLSEIAEELSVSRQAAHDGIRKAKTLLKGYEEQLGLQQQFLKREALLQQAREYIDGITEAYPDLVAHPAMDALKQVLERLSQDEEPDVAE